MMFPVLEEDRAMTTELEFEPHWRRALHADLFTHHAQRFPSAVPEDFVRVGGIDGFYVHVGLVGFGGRATPRHATVVAANDACERRLGSACDIPPGRVQMQEIPIRRV